MLIMITSSVATIIQAVSPLLTVSAGAVAAEAAGAGAVAAAGAGAEASTGLASAAADAAGAAVAAAGAAGVCAMARPPVSRLMPSARETSSFFMFLAFWLTGMFRARP